ncbi:disease resistance protein At4g27190-like [Eucalyptus grandis]|uniref:disease resistance protein At4g27190-like n=1 Tax=Eucalyptus grandis TaxID=71139 RepID=UPI00192E8746|nr:disease resistance protein At4g27190-like [Eucalyptus grandis]
MGCLEELCSCSHRTWIRIRDLLQEIRRPSSGEVQNLENENQRVKVLVEEARRNVRKFLDVFTTWEVNADKALEEARELLDDGKATKTCCYGTLSDPKSRYQFSRKAEGKIEVIKQLTQKCSTFNGLNDISFIDPAFTYSASTSIKLGDDGVFESRALMIRNIMGALAGNSNSVVGVYGMGGIGKSTLLVDVERKISEEKSFHWVAKADVSENPDIKTIQGEIADALGLTEIKNKETISGRAKLLHGRLKDEEREKKKVLIILDNLWERLDLNKVGIPCGHDNRVIGCKLLLTSRDRNVLRSEMGCDKDFPLVSWRRKRQEVCLRGWWETKFMMTSSNPWWMKRSTNVMIKLFKNEGIGEVINERLQLSYKKLKDAEKSLLALCVAYGTSKPSLEYLVRYGVGWGLFREDDNLEEARESLRSGIHTLQASSLLLEDGDDYGFKIHDLVREFVASVASRDHPLLVLKDKDKLLIELLKDKLKSCRAICFPYVNIKELPKELYCPELQIFLLFTNGESLEVLDSLFHSMRKLMVLDLTGICLTCSPSSPFQFLENLHTLCLDSCSLDNVVVLGKLKGLKILSFANSNIHQLPREIGQLVDLRLLDLNHCKQLKIIEPGVLQSLIKLEELYMKNSFHQWDTMDQTPLINASLIELNHMNNLRTLHVSILDPSVLPGDLNLKKLIKYEIRIGNVWHWWSECKGPRTLKLKLDPLGNVLWKGCIQSILGKSDHLCLDNLDRNEQSICALSQEGFLELKHLEVKNSPSIHYIHQSPSHTHFKMLESLRLNNLINLEKLCNSHISSKSFSTLKVIQVKRCDKMEVLFPLSMVRGLPQLEEIKVVGCKRMRGIVDPDDGSKVELHNLRGLELCDLPDIKSFFAIGTAPLSSTLHDQVGTQIAFFNEQQFIIFLLPYPFMSKVIFRFT